MAASILGKRSRQVLESEDNVATLPRSKRRTRGSVPAIFEDEQSLCQSLNASTQTYSRKLQPTRISSTQRKRVHKEQLLHNEKSRSNNQPLKCLVQPVEDLLNTENTPPSITATPTSIRYKNFLDAKSPSTPKHRVRFGGIPWTPKSWDKRWSGSRERNVFSEARQLFTQSSNPTKLIGRESERQQIRSFIVEAIEAKTGGCTYVSGPPGTGKSALVQDVLREFESNEAVETSVINCVSLRTANEIFTKLLQEFAPQSTIGKSSLKQHLTKLFLNKSTDRLRLILLDEIDNLLDTDCEVLYTIFEWAMHKSSSIILIGIANALDLTDRFLPRLKAKGFRPNVLPFLPYNASQISTIISGKLQSLLSGHLSAPAGFVPFMQPAAIQLCGKKIASQSGDLRKAFSLARRVIDQLELETTCKMTETSPTKKPLGEIRNVSEQTLFSRSAQAKQALEIPVAYTVETAPRATIAHVAKIASGIFSNGTLSRLTGLNLQQKAVLCSLVSGEKRKQERDPYATPSKSTSKVPNVKELFMKYAMLCRRDDGLLQPLQDTEFRDVVASLETLGLVHEYKGRTSSLLTPTSTPSRVGRNADDKQIVSAVSEKEMRESLSGAGADLLRRLLDED